MGVMSSQSPPSTDSAQATAPSAGDGPALAALQQEVAALRAQLAQTQQRLHAREGLLQSLSQHIPGVLFKGVVGEDGRFHLHYISQRAAELYELDASRPEALDWDSHYERIHPDDLPAVKRLSATVPTAAGKVARYEYRVLLPVKGLRWMAGQSVALREGPDGRTAWYGYVQDVTEQKLYAEALIAARTAEQASQAKNDFLSRMSHELRTPLNAVIGFAQLLEMDPSHVFTAEHRRRVRLIEQAGQHLLSILGDVLDLSRIEAGALPLLLEPQDVGSVVDEAQELVGSLARKAGVQLRPPEPSPPLTVQADRVRLRQVLVNLLSNAIKYNRQGGQVRLTVAPVPQDGKAPEVAITVRDTGIGMSEAQRAQLFQPFNRLGVEQTGIEGTGIGLVIVDKLVRLMGGRLAVDSTVGQGTAVTLTLPVAERPVDADAPSPQDNTTAAPSRPATILYAEDHEVNIALVHQVVKLRPHWQLRVATNGQRALELARRQRPDLMLVDMHLGDMSGLALAQALDGDEATRDIPRVALSADAMPDRIQAARAHGFRAYLTKPLDVTALLRCLDEQLAQVQGPVPAA